MKNASTDPMIKFREFTINSLARIETHVGTILERQAEDREAIRDALRTHIEEDDAQFRALNEKQEAVSGKVKWILGGLSALSFLSAAAVAAGLIRF